MAHFCSDHNPPHSSTNKSQNERKILLSFFLILIFMVVEFIGGILSGSLALLADAGHMLTDAGALGLAYAAFRLGRLAADHKRTFGYMRLEVIAGLINALTLFIIVFWICYEAWQRFQEPQDILVGPMLGVAVVGLLVNLLVLKILMHGDHDHVNIKGAILHVIGDLLGSVGAVLAACIIYFTNWTLIDPILSVLVSLLILNSAWKLLKKTLHILLEGTPDHINIETIRTHLTQNIPELESISHVHVWLITSGRALATLHARPKDDRDAKQISHAIEKELTNFFGIEHVTVAIDWNDGTESSYCRLKP